MAEKATNSTKTTALGQKSAVAPWRIGVDVGGTFTDLVLTDANGALWTFKSPTNTSDPAKGVLAAVRLAAEGLGLNVNQLLVDCHIFVHGSTIATNIVLQRNGARVGLLTTEGFRDSLEIRQGVREDVWDHRSPFPEVLVPRKLRVPIAERIDKDGNVARALDQETVARAVEIFRREGVEAIAICLLNSYRNDVHEHACAEIIRTLWPEAWISLSSEIAPVIGEYERSSTVVLNAYVAPRVIPYLQSLERALHGYGLKYPLLLIQSNGGAASVEQLTNSAITLALSGPAAGASALQALTEMVGRNDFLLMEIGGTSCDVTLMKSGEIAMVDAIALNDYHLSVPSVEIHSISAGGGTIATVDKGGFLQVGPRGAGARPGPACYGLGGTEPTITDAHVVLGRLRSGRYANGLLTLDEARARSAIEQHIAKPMGISVVEAAAGMIRLMEQSLRHALERMSLERGHDLRQFTLVAGGGAGPLHASPVARMLNCPSVYIPRLAGVFCAFGMCQTDIRKDFRLTWLKPFANGGIQATEPGFERLTAAARASLADSGFDMTETEFQRVLELKYVGQQWALRVPATSLDPLKVRSDFEASYECLFGHSQPDAAIEIVNLRLAGIGGLQRVPLSKKTVVPASAVSTERRAVYIDALSDYADVAVYSAANLRPGHVVDGPALIEEKSTTILLEPGGRLDVDSSDNFLLTVAQKQG